MCSSDLASGQDLPKNIGLKMQYQETSEWCWIAVATSINHFYDSASTATQCSIMTTVGQAINKWPSTTLCCPDTAALASDPKLATALADPDAKNAHNVLGKPDAGIPAVCIKSGGVGDALNINGNWNKPGHSSLTLAQISTEIAAKRPIAVDIKWHSGAQHCVAIAGVLNGMLLICDPIYGESAIKYEAFPSTYRGGGSLRLACLTKKNPRGAGPHGPHHAPLPPRFSENVRTGHERVHGPRANATSISLSPADRPAQRILRLTDEWCGRPDLNRHGKLLPRDFKSLASTISPRPQRGLHVSPPTDPDAKSA